MNLEITEIINEVLTGKEKFDEADDKWFDYLEECLTFPFSATIKNSEKSVLLVTGLNLYEKDTSGIIVNVKWRNDYLQYDLCNLEIKDADIFNNAIYLAAYSTWFAKASKKKSKK